MGLLHSTRVWGAELIGRSFLAYQAVARLCGYARNLDDLARDYLLLALSLGTHIDGLVDAYYGPQELREQAEARQVTPAQLAEDAIELRARAAGEPDAQRALWLDRQLIALETLARRSAGEDMAYLDEVERCFDARPEPTPSHAYAEARDQLDDLLPQGPDLRERLEARDRRLTVPADRVPAILDWLTAEIRRSSLERFPAPDGESLTLSMVSNQPWGAYNWYDGGLRSRIEINTDLPSRAHALIGLIAHEAFPGHHLEHAWKEQRLVREMGRGEATVLLINTPEAYISEGLANLGSRYAIEPPRWEELLTGICQQAGIALERGDAEREWRITQALRGLRGSGGDAALLLHVSRRPREEVLRFLEEECLRSREQAEKNLEFISHPLWRTYVFCYGGGEELLSRWCAEAGDIDAQRQRFFRLLTEQLTPSGVTAGHVQ